MNEKIHVRKPPIGAVLSQHKQGVRGLCGWCGLAVEEKTPARGYLKFWHDACAVEMAVIEQPAMARYHVEERDHGICCDCGEDWSEMYRLVPEYRERATGAPRICWAVEREEGCGGFSTSYSDRSGGFPFVELRAISLWHVDHKVPLWKVAHMPDLQRLEYFKLANLITRCHECHGQKTRKEAGDRAKINNAVEPPPEKPKQRIQSRPFQKGVKKPWPKRKM